MEPSFGVLDVLIGHYQLAERVRHLEREQFIVDPQSLGLICYVLKDLISFDHFLCVFLDAHAHPPLHRSLVFYKSVIHLPADPYR